MITKVDLSPQSYLPQAQPNPTEAELRVQLAAAYRLMSKFKMTDLVYTHLSVRLPGPEHHFLINPYGLMFHEITASSLVKIDVDGNIVEQSDWAVNPAGFVIHSAIHMARKDVTCVMHSHSRYGTAVSALKCGLLPISQFAMQYFRRIAYHDYEGVSLSLDERERLIADIGDKKAMILRNHGLLTVGRTIPEAFVLLYYLERSCEVQILAQSAGSELVLPSEEVCEHSAKQQELEDYGQLEWQALIRMLDQEDPSYRN
jgi:ribulose-5-phosphate 4-epimerase/fuculose-1-phosphate aldolase